MIKRPTIAYSLTPRIPIDNSTAHSYEWPLLPNSRHPSRPIDPYNSSNTHSIDTRFSNALLDSPILNPAKTRPSELYLGYPQNLVGWAPCSRPNRTHKPSHSAKSDALNQFWDSRIDKTILEKCPVFYLPSQPFYDPQYDIVNLNRHSMQMLLPNSLWHINSNPSSATDCGTIHDLHKRPVESTIHNADRHNDSMHRQMSALTAANPHILRQKSTRKNHCPTIFDVQHLPKPPLINRNSPKKHLV